MKDNFYFFLSIAVIILVVFALIEKSKWQSKNKDVLSATYSQNKLSFPQAVQNSSTALSGMGSSFSPTSAEKNETYKNNDMVWVLFDLEYTPQDSFDKIKFYLERFLIENPQKIKASQIQKHAAIYRFTPRAQDIPAYEAEHFKLKVDIEKEKSADRWILKLGLKKIKKTNENISISVQEKFPLPSPLPSYKILYTDESIAGQMSSVITETLSNFNKIDEIRNGVSAQGL